MRLGLVPFPCKTKTLFVFAPPTATPWEWLSDPSRSTEIGVPGCSLKLIFLIFSTVTKCSSFFHFPFLLPHCLSCLPGRSAIWKPLSIFHFPGWFGGLTQGSLVLHIQHLLGCFRKGSLTLRLALPRPSRMDMRHHNRGMAGEVLQSVQILRGDHHLHGFNVCHASVLEKLHGIKKTMGCCKTHASHAYTCQPLGFSFCFCCFDLQKLLGFTLLNCSFSPPSLGNDIVHGSQD